MILFRKKYENIQKPVKEIRKTEIRKIKIRFASAIKLSNMKKTLDSDGEKIVFPWFEILTCHDKIRNVF